MDVVYTKATEDNFEELVKFANEVFDIRFPELLPKLYKQEYRTMPHHYIVKEDNKIKAAIGSFPMEIDIFGEKLQIRGIGTVSVHKECRGSGYMKKLMNMALDDMKKEGVAISCLGGQRQRYEYFSYLPCGPQINFHISETNIRHKFRSNIDLDISFKSVNEDDINIIENMYNLYNKENIKVNRRKNEFLDILKSWDSEVYSIVKNNELVGYVVLSENKTSINELILRDEDLFISVIASHIKSNNIHGINISVPLYAQKRIKAAQQLCESYSISNNCQFTVLDYEKVITALLKAKSTYKNLEDGELNISIKDYGTVSISVQDSKIDVSKTDEQGDICLEHLDAMQLLFSPLTAYSKLPENVDKCVESWLPLPLYINRADHV